MRRTRALVLISLPVILIAGCSAPGAVTPERQIVDDASAAMGGLAAIRAVDTLSIEGSGDVFALGQNRTLTSELLKWRVTEYRRSIDFRNRRWRDESTHTPTFVTGWPDPFRVVAGYDADVAFDVDDGTPSRLGASVTRDRRAELYHHPIGFLRAASEEGARMENARHASGHDSVDLITPDGERFTLMIDSESRRPARIVSTGYEPVLGDVSVTTDLDDFVDSGDLTVPTRFIRRIDDAVVSDIRITKTEVNAKIEDLQAPVEVRAAAMPTPVARVIEEEVAPGIWYLTGEGHHSVLVELADRLVLIEAPVDDTRTLAVIAKARALRPGKQLTHVINTHHHFDHSGGIRAAISKGLTVITHESNRSFFEMVAARPSTVVRDALTRNPRPLSIETVAEKKVLTDGRRSIEIYPVSDNGHCASMLMIYFPAERLLVEADAYQPPQPQWPAPVAHPFAANLLDNIERRSLRVDRLLPLHGHSVPFADLVAAARQTSRQAAKGGA